MKLTIIIFIILSILGCDFESPEVRYQSSIKAFTVGDTKYDSVELDNGIVNRRCTVDSAAAFCYDDGTLIDVGGLRFEVTGGTAEYFVFNSSGGGGYWVHTDEAGVVSTLVTNATGYCEFSSWCTLWGVTQTKAGMSAKGKRTPEMAVSAGQFANYRNPLDGLRTLIPWYTNIYVQGVGWVQGGDLFCKGPLFQGGPLQREDMIPSTPANVSNMISENDTLFLADTSLVSSSGFTMHASSWCRMAGENGKGYAKEVQSITPLTHSDPHIITFWSTPYFLSLEVVLSDEVTSNDVESSTLSAILYSGDTVAGTIKMKVSAISDDRMRVIVHSEYIVPIDARDYDENEAPIAVYDRWTTGDPPSSVQIYAPKFLDGIDPNTVSDGIIVSNVDPNRMVPVHCVPITGNQRLRIVVDKKDILTSVALEHWLSDYKTLDMNGDGIVNLKDYFVDMFP